MRTISEAFVAGVKQEFFIPGNRLEILSCSGAGTVTVSLQNANGVEITNGLATGVEAGTYMVPDGGFKRVAITSSTSQTVKFLISYGESGTRSVAGTVQVAGTVKTQATGLQYTGSYAAVGATLPTANTAVMVVNPTLNVAGITVHLSQLQHTDAGAGLAVLIAKASAPASVTDGDVLNIAVNGAGVSTVQTPLFVPAGKGLYLIANLIETGGVKNVLYSIL
ncbi:hypothetical protein [Lacisediminimonas profundi]|uniref:hypothetical protein n=1 Tax=Lacisediminimonas profundi TaxID=2603856 RepID=UPI00124B184C|nr:hypothetical protein [Lacisediminimonas profundi]